MKWVAEFDHAIGDKVYVDSDSRMAFTVVGIAIFSRGIEYSIAWVNEGNLNQATIDAFRLSPADG
jgi:hypothetical protein